MGGREIGKNARGCCATPAAEKTDKMLAISGQISTMRVVMYYSHVYQQNLQRILQSADPSQQLRKYSLHVAANKSIMTELAGKEFPQTFLIRSHIGRSSFAITQLKQ